MLYRVIRQITSSLQPGRGGATYWQRTVLYCGYDLDEARRIYHESEPTDFGSSYGNRAAETLFERLDPSELDDDEVGVMISADPDEV